MYTDIFKYVQGNEFEVQKIEAREDFMCLHRKAAKSREEGETKEYRRLRRLEHNTFLASVDLKERYHRTYRDKPIESVMS